MGKELKNYFRGKIMKRFFIFILSAFLVIPGIVFATDYSKQMYLVRIGYPDVTRGSTTRGKGVIVAIIDEGVWLEHPDLQNSIWTNQNEISQNSVDDDNNGYVDDYYGWNFIDNDSNMQTKGSHGTSVAGIIAADENEIGISGITPNVKIMSLIACDENACPTGAVQKAIKYAADMGAGVINLSLGGQGFVGYNSSYDPYIKYAYDKGAIIVASAGNGDVESAGQVGQNLNFIKVSPASNDVGGVNMVVGVGATDGWNPVPWSNYGSSVDVWAPGLEILTTIVPKYNSGYGYATLSGTSFSAPMVSAVAALLKARQPSLRNWEIVDLLKLNTNLDIAKIFSASPQPCKLNKILPAKIMAGDKVTVYGEHITSGIVPIFTGQENSTVSIPRNAIQFLDASQFKIDTSQLNLKAGDYSIDDHESVYKCRRDYIVLSVEQQSKNEQPPVVLPPQVIPVVVDVSGQKLVSVEKNNNGVMKVNPVNNITPTEIIEVKKLTVNTTDTPAPVKIVSESVKEIGIFEKVGEKFDSIIHSVMDLLRGIFAKIKFWQS